MEQEHLWTPSYEALITDDHSKDLELAVFSVKIDICEDLLEKKELLKVLTAGKVKMARTTAGKIKESQINSIGNWPKNTPIKHTGKKKSLSTIVGLLRHLQSDIQRMLMETNIVFLK